MSKRVLVCGGVGALTITASFFSFDVAVFPMTAVAVFPFLLVALVVLGALSLRKGDVTSRRRARSVAIATAYVVAIYVGCGLGYRAMLLAVEEQAQPVIDALESHREKTSTYPAAVSELVPSSLPALPWRFEGGVRSALGGRFRYTSNGDTYGLTIDTFLFQRLSYSPGDGWYTWD